jgi:RNA polymerase sigma-70 factor (ECF subfamily)
MCTAVPDLQQLLSLARAGSSQALGQLLEVYRNYLALLARVQIGRRLQGKVEAADLVQETFLAAHRDFARFRGTTEGQFVRWLRQILAGNLADLVKHYFNARRRDVRLERQLADELDRSSRVLTQSLVARGSSPSQHAVRRELAVYLANALQTLPAEYGEVIILHHLQELTFPEVARHMGRSLDSVKKLWVRALARLRHSLGESP